MAQEDNGKSEYEKMLEAQIRLGITDDNIEDAGTDLNK